MAELPGRRVSVTSFKGKTNPEFRRNRPDHSGAVYQFGVGSLPAGDIPSEANQVSLTVDLSWTVSNEVLHEGDLRIGTFQDQLSLFDHRALVSNRVDKFTDSRFGTSGVLSKDQDTRFSLSEPKHQFSADMAIGIQPTSSLLADTLQAIAVRKSPRFDCRFRLLQTCESSSDLLVEVGAFTRSTADLNLTIFQLLLHEEHPIAVE